MQKNRKRWGIETLFGALKTRGFNFEDTRKRMPLNTLKIAGSPSILIVDKTRKIVNGWVGKLSPQEEKNV
jgi:hypothetical protein